ncbi:hypothetical protein [Nocardia sp. NBC_00511]|uniref:hypothetical protein n=1 Tax=Nocardia sp. NBC_00511 TaxID=2903591 RepID=UPI0030E4D72B
MLTDRPAQSEPEPPAGSPVVRVVWIVLVVVGGLLIPVIGWFAGALVGYAVSPHEDINGAIPLGGVIGVVLAIVGWRILLHGIGRRRLSYLRRTGSVVSGSVRSAEYRHIHNPRGPGAHMVTLRAVYRCPATGSDYRIRRAYRFPERARAQAQALCARFPPGSPITLVVKGGGAAGFDIPERPYWPFLW